MTTYQTVEQQRESQSHPGDEAHLPILGLIERLEAVCRADTPAETFVREILRGLVALSDALYGALWSVDHQTGRLVVAQELTPQVSARGAQEWAPALGELAASVLQQSILCYRAVSGPSDPPLNGQDHVALGLPLTGEASIAGCVTLVVQPDNPILSDGGIALLRLLADFGRLYAARQDAARFEGFYRSLSSAWEVIGETLAFERFREMAQVFVDRSRLALQAERVSLGVVRRGKVAVVAISGEDTIDKRSNLVRLIQAAQGEVVVSGEPGSYRESAPGEEQALQLARNPQQERLAQASNAKAIYSVPLRKGKDLVAVCTFEYGGAPLTEEIRRVIDVLAGQAGPLLHLAIQSDRGLFRRAGDSVAAATRWLFGREHPWHKAGLVAALLFLGFVVFGRWDFTVAGNCKLEPSFRRIYAAPFDTTIQAAPVRPGDTVARGQTLVALDREEMELRLREARSKYHSAEKEMSSYLAEQKIAQYAEARARREALAAEIALLERYIARTAVRAEFGGIVIAGDLRRDIGRAVRMGEPLVEVAPLSSLILEIEIDQGDIAYVSSGQEGRFTTKARPSVAIPFTVSKLRPAPEIRQQASVYVAEARVSNRDGRLRPGMEGAARISVDRANVTWVALRKIVNWIRLRVWW